MKATTDKDYYRGKRGREASKQKGENDKDICYSPGYIIEALDAYVPLSGATIWESAVGGGYLYNALVDKYPDNKIIGTGIPDNDYFHYQPKNYDLQLTNPPFGPKYRWIDLALYRKKDFALIVPADIVGTVSHSRYVRLGCELLVMTPRVDYYTPNRGWSGKGASFTSAWLTRGLNIGYRLDYFDISILKAEFERLL